MKSYRFKCAGVVFTLLVGAVIGFACSESARHPAGTAKASQSDAAAAAKPVKVQRVGSVIGLRPEKKDYYNKLHANPWPAVNPMLKKCNFRSYSIFETEIEGKLYLFSYFEYIGDDFKADMAKLYADPKIKEWLKETDPCQIRLPGTPDGEQWKDIPEVYHLD